LNRLNILFVKALILILILASPVIAAAQGPSDAALQFIEKIRNNNVDLTPGTITAITPQTSDKKRDQIARHYARIAQTLSARPIEAGHEKTDGDLAAVIVWAPHGYDPDQVQVFPVAMIKHQEKWIPAPVLGSFENAGAGYTEETRQRIAQLENWMLRQQSLDLTMMREQVIDRMRQSIQQKLSKDTLKQLKPSQIIINFLKACQSGSEYEMLGYLGGLSDKLPEDWSLRITNVAKSVNDPNKHRAWRLLTSPNAMRVMVSYEENQNDALASYACIDPTVRSLTPPKIQLLHIALTKSTDGLWRVDLPSIFWQPNEASSPDADEALDNDLLDAFPAMLRKSFPAQPSPSAKEAQESLRSKLFSGTFTDMIPLIQFPSDPKQAREAIIHAAKDWSNLHPPSTNTPDTPLQMLVSLGSMEQGSLAITTHQWFSTRKPDRFQLMVMVYKHTDNGWLWIPNPTEELSEPRIRQWLSDQENQWKSRWPEAMLESCSIVAAPKADTTPTPEQAKQLIASWYAALTAGDTPKALSLCARLNLQDSPRSLLRNLAYEYTGVLKNEKPPEVLHVFNDSGWIGVGVKSKIGNKATYPLYIITATASGPKILLEIDLIAADGRSRDFLNISNLERLTAFDQPSSAAIRRLFEQHEKAVAPQLKE
jgi:hypothetical protein